MRDSTVLGGLSRFQQDALFPDFRHFVDDSCVRTRSLCIQDSAAEETLAEESLKCEYHIMNKVKKEKFHYCKMNAAEWT